MREKTKVAVSLFDKYADLYQEKYMDVGLYHESLDIICALVAMEGASLLELACGPGNITRYLLHKRPDFNILGTDLSPKMLELAAKNNPAATFQLLDARALLQLGQKFDAIIAGFCLPYLSKRDAIQLIHDAGQALQENGLLYLSTMEDLYQKSGPRKSSQGDEMYQYFHEGTYLKKALSDHGFILVLEQRKQYPAGDGADTVDLILIARKTG